MSTLTPAETAVMEIEKHPLSMRFGPLELTSIGIKSNSKPEVVDILAAGRMISQCDSGVQFWIGDLILYAENTRGMADILDQAISNWSFGLQSLEQAKRVAQEWPYRLRDPAVAWSIYRVSLGLEHMEDRLELIRRAKGEGLTVREATKAAREMKHQRLTGGEPGKPKPDADRYAYAIVEPDFWVPDGIVGLPGSPVQGRGGQKPAADWAALDICALLREDATVYILTTPTTLDEAIKLARKFGLVYRTVMSMSWDEPADTYQYHAANNQIMAVVATVGYPGRIGEPEGASNHPNAVGARTWLYGALQDLYAGEKGVAVFAKPPTEFKADYGLADLLGVNYE